VRPQSQELREATADAQLRFVPERVRAHARHGDQGFVLRRVGAVVGDLDLIAHLFFLPVVVAPPRCLTRTVGGEVVLAKPREVAARR
jgi:hypothetical protein